MSSSPSERWPDFLLIGAPKAGTTALFRTLSEHPQVFASPVKEPRFFICSGSRPHFPCPAGKSHSETITYPDKDYLELFKACPDHAKAGEASTPYLHDPGAAANAFEKVPAARIIAVLRHPVDRAYSQWLHLRHDGFETSADFETAWMLESEYKSRGWRSDFYLKERGLYAEQLERWLDYYPREQVLILFYEDWLNHPRETLGLVCKHLGIDDFESPSLSARNVTSREPRWKWLHQRMVQDNRLRKWAQAYLPLWVRDAITLPIRRVNLKSGPQLEATLRARLASGFHDDIQKLEKLTGRKLDHWRC